VVAGDMLLLCCVFAAHVMWPQECSAPTPSVKVAID